MADKAPSIDSPTQNYNGVGHPGNAASLPTKTYPASTKMATAGSSNTIDSPASKK